MASIKMGEEKKELADNSEIRDTCEEMGVPFGCKNGICGACQIEVVSGGENLSELTENETSMGMENSPSWS